MIVSLTRAFNAALLIALVVVSTAGCSAFQKMKPGNREAALKAQQAHDLQFKVMRFADEYAGAVNESLGRMQKTTMRWIAERIADQRLLWQLRKQDAATLHVPADLDATEAGTILRASMKRDADFHRNRLILHSLALILSVPVALVPGPNILGYLFTFTVVGHFLSWRGAVKGLHQIAWTIEPNQALTELRKAFALDAASRHRAIQDASHRLHLPKMALFVERMATPT